MPNKHRQQHLEHETLHYVDLFEYHNAAPVEKNIILFNSNKLML
jgi:hypothetical protein